MAIDGTYKLSVNTPMGSQEVTLTLKTDGGTLSGSSVSSMGSQDFSGGTVDGDSFAFSMNINGPMGQMDLDFKGKVDGDELSGDVKLGSFGTATFKGNRT